MLNNLGFHILKKQDYTFICKVAGVILCSVGLGGLGVTCSPRDPRFAGSNPGEVNGFFLGRKNPEHKSSGRDLGLGVPSLRFQAKPEKIGL